MRMETKHKATIEKLTWKTARTLVSKVHPTLSQIIDKLDPNKDFALFKACYPFGTKIVDAGTMQLPTYDGKVVPLNSVAAPDDIKNNLQWRSVPISLILKGFSEIYFETIDSVISLNGLSPGNILGLWESLDPPQSYYVKCIWSAISGARSLYLLPKITDAVSHKELRKKYGVRAQLPKGLIDQWRIFAEIANSQAFPQEWCSEILFFSDKWMDTATKDPAWKEFHNFMLQDGWNQSQYWRNKVTFDVIWELFIRQLIEQNVKPNPYLVSIVKQLVLVGTGVLSGFCAATDDLVAPVSGFQKILIEDYRLKDYVPTFMRPAVFDFNSTNTPFVYFSLQQPSMLETPLVSRQLQSVLKAIPEISFIIDTFILEVNQGQIRAENTPIEIFAKKVSFDYFHNEVGDHIENVRHTSEMPKEDPSLLTMPPNNSQRIFASTSRFIKGCVRFSTRKTE